MCEIGYHGQIDQVSESSPMKSEVFNWEIDKLNLKEVMVRHRVICVYGVENRCLNYIMILEKFPRMSWE